MAPKLAPKIPHVPAVWFAGVCDTLLQRIQMWAHKYEQGEVYATRPYMTVESKDIVDVPVQFLHTIPFTLVEMKHLVRILNQEKPRERLTEDFVRLLAIISNPLRLRQVPKMIVMRPGGIFVIRLMLEKVEVVDLAELLLSVKEGRSGQLSVVDTHLAKQLKAGKGMWQS
jgi:hypothetical protein